MPELNPGQLSRQQIDEQLRACGWIVQDYRAIDFSAGRGIAVREVPLKTGPCDYLLLVDRKALGVVEAKKVGTTLSTVADQSSRYSILRGEDLPDGADDISGAELAAALGVTRSRDVVYNGKVPIEMFDFIIPDECHRSIYNLWRQVLEYFDGFLTGLTATPAPQTMAYFQQNCVAEDNHERAVTDGVNVGYDVYRIKTKVTEKGGKVEKGFLIDHRSKASRKARKEVLADDLDYTPQDLDRSVVVPDQIRTVLSTYRDVVFTELFPDRTLDRKPTVPLKTLLQRVIFPAGRDEDTLTTLAARLAQPARRTRQSLSIVRRPTADAA